MVDSTEGHRPSLMEGGVAILDGPCFTPKASTLGPRILEYGPNLYMSQIVTRLRVAAAHTCSGQNDLINGTIHQRIAGLAFFLVLALCVFRNGDRNWNRDRYWRCLIPFIPPIDSRIQEYGCSYCNRGGTNNLTRRESGYRKSPRKPTVTVY